MDKLRNELVEYDKLRADFLKWKLLLIAVLGGTGLSGKVMDGTLMPEARLFVLLLIPFVCVYADLLCLQNSLRVYSVKRFICGHVDPPSDVDPIVVYERLGRGLDTISLETFALFWSTLLVDIAVAFAGALQHDAKAWTKGVVVFQVTAVAGVVIAIVIGLVFKANLDLISKLFPYAGDGQPRDGRIVRRLAFGTIIALLVIVLGPPLVL